MDNIEEQNSERKNLKEVDVLELGNFSFTLLYLGDSRDDWRWRGRQDQCDTCRHIIEVRPTNFDRHNDLIVFEIWSLYDDFTVELKSTTDYFTSARSDTTNSHWASPNLFRSATPI